SYVSPFDYQPMFSLSLLGELLLTGPTDMALVDTVEKAARWRIELSGQRAKAKLNEKDLVQTCLNFQAWSLDRPSSETDDDDDQNVFPLERRQFRFWDGMRNFVIVDTGGMETRQCYVEITNGP